MPSLRFHPEAHAEAEESALWYELRQEGLGQDFLSELDRAIALILETPTTWPLWPGVSRALKVRRFLLARFPFAIAYEVSADDIVVYSVVHLSRKPGYWKDRVIS